MSSMGDAEQTSERAQITRAWRGVPPKGVKHDRPELPTWSETRGFTQENARANLTDWYGEDWTLQEQVTTVSAWVDVTYPTGGTND